MAYFWTNYNEIPSPSTGNISSTNVATQVLDAYDIPYSSANTPPAGNLGGIDLKHVSSMSALQMSLSESSAKGDSIYEVVVNGEGEVEFKTIGTETLDTSDLYFVTLGRNFRHNNTSVSVTGRQPLPTRFLKTPYDLLQDKKIWSTDKFLRNCYSSEFNVHSTITFRDPHIRHSSGNNYEDGIDGTAYTSDTPYEKIITWIWDIDPNMTLEPETTIKYVTTAQGLPILVSGEIDVDNTRTAADANADIGTLIRRDSGIDPSTSNNVLCAVFQGQRAVCDGNATISVELPDQLRYEQLRADTPPVDKFGGIENVYVVGWEIDSYYSRPKTGDSSKGVPSTSNSQVVISIPSLNKKIITLKQGEHYAAAYDNSTVTGKVCIQFANNSPLGNPTTYGKDVTYQVHPNCWYASSGVTEGVGSILPLDRQKAFLVDQVFATVALESPSIKINDMTGKAMEIADSLRAQITAIAMSSPPAPLAINGVLIDQTESIPDNDPTTLQDFTHTQYEEVLTSSDAGPSIDVTVATLSESETITLSSNLYSLINDDTGAVATYTFGPNGAPVVGTRTPHGIVNSVSYNYTDSGSYTISAQTGPILAGGLASINGAPTMKKTQNISGEGLVVQNEGNGARYKVAVEGYGTVLAYNRTSDIIRVGDRVTVTIENVPVEA